MSEMTYIDPIDELLKEHQDVYAELRVLEEELKELETRDSLTDEQREKLQGWAREFEKHLRLHIDKEDNHLFPALGKYIGTGGGPLAVMEMEHRGVEQHIEKFTEGLKLGWELGQEQI